MSDINFSVNIAQCVTSLSVFCFVLFYLFVKWLYSGHFLFVETGCSVLSLLNYWTWTNLKLQRTKAGRIDKP